MSEVRLPIIITFCSKVIK